MDRLINVKVSGSHLWKDSKLAGTQHEGNVNRLRITFDEGWEGYAKKVTFWDAKGQNPVERTLTVDLLEDIRQSTLIYICPIPSEPMAEAGMMTFVIEGYLDGKRARSVGAELEVEASPYVDEAGQPVDPTPTQAEQIQGQIENILGDMQEQATLAIDAADKAYKRKEEAEYARDLAEHSARAAATSENDAAASAASAADSANAASECWREADEAMVTAKQYAWEASLEKERAERFADYAEQHVAEAEEKKQEAAASADRAADIKNEIANVLHESEAHRDRAEAAAQRAAGSEAAVASSAAAAKDAANVASECYTGASEAMLDAQQAAWDAGYARDQAKTYADSISGSVEKAAASATAAGHSQVLAESAADGAEMLFEMTKSHAELAKREASDAVTWANIAKQSAEGVDAIKEAAEAAKNDAEKAKLSIENMKITGETVEHDSAYSAVEKYTEADGTVHLHLNLRQGNPGVYVGDGAFPSGYSVQVSPNGEGMDIPEMVENAVRTGLQEAKDSGEFDGPKGNPGDDGISPTVAVTEIEGGHRVSITDKNGTKTFDVLDGADGEGGGGTGDVWTGYATQDPNTLKVAVEVYKNGELCQETLSAVVQMEIARAVWSDVFAFSIANGEATSKAAPDASERRLRLKVNGDNNKFCCIIPVEFGAGSGSALHWDNIEGRPFGDGKMTLLEETTITVVGNMATLPSNVPFEAGETYTIHWAGTEYECVAQDAVYEGIPCVVVGNPYFLGGENNDMPFAIGYAALMSATMAIAMADGDYTLSVEGTGVQKLDNKYLDLAWLPTINYEWETLVSNEEATGAALSAYDFTKAATARSVQVLLNPNSLQNLSIHICKPLSLMDGYAFALGNLGLLGDAYPGTGEPFCLLFQNDGGRYELAVIHSDIELETISISAEVAHYNTLPDAFLPSSADGEFSLNGNDIEEDINVLNNIAAACRKSGAARCVYKGYPYTVLDAGGDLEGYKLLLFRVMGALPGQPSYEMYVLHYTMYDVKLMPYLTEKALYLDSSTNNSTKTFKITVDDNGTLSVAYAYDHD